MLWTLKKIWYRVFQFVLTSVMYLLPWRQPELLTGPGSIKKLPAFIKSKGVNNVLIVTDSVLRKLGVLDSFLAACDAAGLKGVVYDGVEPNPSIENIEEARKLYVDNKCDGIVAFGGGSAMDCAKAAGPASMAMLTAAVFFSSLWFTFRDSFAADGAPALSEPTP